MFNSTHENARLAGNVLIIAQIRSLIKLICPGTNTPGLFREINVPGV
jgi:hypothetical protein